MAKRGVLSDHEEKALWTAWTEQRDAGARQKLIEHHLPFAQMLAAKLYARRQVDQVEFEEYRQYATVGMIESVDRFDVLRNASFRTFAGHRITGAILSGIEKSCEKQQQITARASLRQQRLESMRDGATKARPPDLFAELAELAVGLALGYMLEDSGMYQAQEEHYTEHFYDRHELNQLKETIKRIVEVLPDQARSVVCYHYYQGLSFEEIAKMLDLSKGRISQIHRQALKLLQEIYSGAEGLNLRL
jgi:RNA polymerase sigma factor for flagellar operon FliA